MLDLLPTLGQTKVVSILYELIEDRIITATEAATMINMFALTTKSTAQAIKQLMVSFIISIIIKNHDFSLLLLPSIHVKVAVLVSISSFKSGICYVANIFLTFTQFKRKMLGGRGYNIDECSYRQRLLTSVVIGRGY